MTTRIWITIALGLITLACAIGGLTSANPFWILLLGANAGMAGVNIALDFGRHWE